MPAENGLPQYVSKHARTGLYQYYRRPPKGVVGAAFVRSFGSKDRKTVHQKYAAIHDDAEEYFERLIAGRTISDEQLLLMAVTMYPQLDRATGKMDGPEDFRALVQKHGTDEMPSPCLATARRPDLADNPALPEIGLKSSNGPDFTIAPEQIPDRLRFGLINDELAVFDVVAQRQVAPHPHALALGRRDLVPDTLAGDLPLELGERQQHIQRQPSHRRSGVELLGDR